MANVERYKGPMPNAMEPRGADVQRHARDLGFPGSEARLVVFKNEDGYLQGEGEKGMLVVPIKEQVRKASLDELGDALLLDTLAQKSPGSERIKNRKYEMQPLSGEALNFALRIFQTQPERIMEAPIASQHDGGKINFDTRLLSDIFTRQIAG